MPLHAFPTTDYFDEKPIGLSPGMELRDYFAAKALAGLLAAESSASGNGAIFVDGGKAKLCDNPMNFAKISYQLADAMMAARKEKA